MGVSKALVNAEYNNLGRLSGDPILRGSTGGLR
jgi:hypothetical protein